MTWYPVKSFLYWLSSYFRPHQRGPVRRMFSSGILATVAIGLYAAISMSVSDTTVSLLPVSGQETVRVGDTFTVDVRVDAGVPVNAVEMDLLYPESFVRVEQLRDGESVLTIWTEEPSAENGVVHLRGGTFRKGFVGEHRIISLTMQAVQPGTFSIQPKHVLLLAGDGEGTEIVPDNLDEITLRMTAVADANTTQAAASVATEITDLNGDGSVTMGDISMFMSAWGDGSSVYDFTGDNRMSFPDFSILLSHYFFGR